jgi:thiol-disulfide isomerase/thioredoxin
MKIKIESKSLGRKHKEDIKDVSHVELYSSAVIPKEYMMRIYHWTKDKQTSIEGIKIADPETPFMIKFLDEDAFDCPDYLYENRGVSCLKYTDPKLCERSDCPFNKRINARKTALVEEGMRKIIGSFEELYHTKHPEIWNENDIHEFYRRAKAEIEELKKGIKYIPFKELKEKYDIALNEMSELQVKNAELKHFEEIRNYHDDLLKKDEIVKIDFSDWDKPKLIKRIRFAEEQWVFYSNYYNSTCGVIDEQKEEIDKLKKDNKNHVLEIIDKGNRITELLRQNEYIRKQCDELDKRNTELNKIKEDKNVVPIPEFVTKLIKKIKEKDEEFKELRFHDIFNRIAIRHIKGKYGELDEDYLTLCKDRDLYRRRIQQLFFDDIFNRIAIREIKKKLEKSENIRLEYYGKWENIKSVEEAKLEEKIRELENNIEETIKEMDIIFLNDLHLLSAGRIKKVHNILKNKLKGK